MRTSRKGQTVLTAQPADDKRSMVRFCPWSVASGHSAYSVDVFLVHARQCTSPLVSFPVLAFLIFLLNGPLQKKTVNHVFDLTAEVQPPEPPLAPASAAAGASTSISSSAATEGGGGTAAAAPGGHPFSSSQAPRGVRSHPSLDSEAMVDAALSNMIHDIDELPSLPPLSDLAGPVARMHTRAHAHSSLDIFDAF